jgi:hypothetical protein
MTTQMQPVNPASQIETRLDRIRSWHAITSAKAFETRLLIFFTGMEIKGLMSELGITQGARTDLPGTSETISEVSRGKAETWQELLALECGITDRSARNYVAFYEQMIFRAPAFVEWVIKHAAPRIEGPSDKLLALPDPHAVIAKIDPEALQAFRDANDPYTLSELYEKPLKPAIAQARAEQAKKKSDEKEEQAYFDFWCGEMEKAARKRTWHVLPPPQRKVLLETLENTIREIKASLKGEE